MKYLLKKNRRIILLSLFFLLAYPIAGSSNNNNETALGDIFNELGIYIEGVGDFVVKKSILREGRENTFWTIVAKKNERAIKIEVIKNIDNNSAYRHIKERKYVIRSLYNNISSPYPGMISNSIEMPDEFKPKVMHIEIEKEEIPVYLLSSTARFTYGAGSDDLIKYRGALAFIYNQKEKILYRIDLFVAKEKYKEKEVLQWLSSLKFIRQDKTGRENKSGIAKIKEPDRTGPKNIVASQADWGHLKDYNLIIIGFEPLGAKHIGAYGYGKDTTPNLDKFSKTSFLFENAVSPSSWTLPVFMSWFTSLYPSQHKIVNKFITNTGEVQISSNLSALSPSVVTLAQVLKQNGYSTAGFTGGAGVAGTFGYNLGFDLYYDQTTFGGYDLVMPMALDWLQIHKEEKFFIFIQGFDVHGRYPLPDNYENKFSNPYYNGKYKGTVEEYWKLRNLSIDKSKLDILPEDVKFWESIYDAKIYEADRKFGRCIESLEELGLKDKTIIFISSGSGNEFYEHKRFDHGFSLYEELIHVPLIIKIPGKRGRPVSEQVRTIDIMPTVLDLLDINYNGTIANQMQGVSLAPLMRGEELSLDAFSETDYLLQAFKRSLRTPHGWKYIYSMDTGQRELFNLKKDPQELKNLVLTEKKIAYELEQKLFKHLNFLAIDVSRP